MNFGLCKSGAGCATPGACAERAASACQVAGMDSTMGALDQAGSKPVSIMHSTRVLELHEAPSVEMATSALVDVCHGASMKAGWWINPHTGVDARDNPMCFAQKLCLIHSEISEAMEGDRKSLKDDKLPHRDMREVELADALIRICDLAGAYGMDLGGAVAEKLAFNAVRPDHKAEVRAAAGGKAY